MPAGLPGDTLFNNQGNPNAGRFVTFDPLSGPKGAPLDAKKIDYSTGTPAGWDATLRIPIKINDDANISTGGMSTGIGIGGLHIISITPPATTAPQAIFNAGFNDNKIPGETPTYAAAPPNGVVSSDAVDSRRMYIGGGRASIVAGTGPATAGNPTGNGWPAAAKVSVPNPYTAGIAICGAGNGSSRDSGANTGFPLKMVTATGAVANGAAIEAGWTNRTNVAMVSGQSAFGSGTAALAAAS